MQSSPLISIRKSAHTAKSSLRLNAQLFDPVHPIDQVLPDGGSELFWLQKQLASNRQRLASILAVHIKQTDLAAMLGVTRQTVNKELSAFMVLVDEEDRARA